MTSETKVIGVEILVPRISEAVSFFEEVLGWTAVFRGPAEHAPGEVAVIDGGNIALTLFEPKTDDSDAIADDSPRITQLVVGGAAGTLPGCLSAVRDAGLPVTDTPTGSFIPPQVGQGVFGFPLAVSFRALPDDETS